jgi:hypothetical protein
VTAFFAIVNGFWLVVGPDYMRYFAVFWLGWGLSFNSLAAFGRLKPPPTRDPKDPVPR